MNTVTVIGLYDNGEKADMAVSKLISEGFKGDTIHLKRPRDYMEVEHREGFTESVRNFLTDLGLTGREPGEKEGILVTVDTDEDSADQAADILNSAGALDIDERMAQAHAGAPPETGKKIEPQKAEAGQVIPEVEEQVKIGTRTVSRGGVRIYTHPTEKMVEEPVTLREEEVHVERRPVDRPAGTGEMGEFREESFEIRTKGEEPIVGKETHVKEEVVVGKEAKEHVETVREKVRGTKVEVEQLAPEEEQTFTSLEDEFRGDYSSHYAAAGISYDEVLPVYRYGYHLGQDRRFHDGSWDRIEPKVRQDWEEHNYADWDFYKEAVHTGWERAVHPH